MVTSRLAAVKTVIRIIRDSAYSNIELSHTSEAAEMSREDTALYAAIVRTVAERRLTLDLAISAFVRKKPDITVQCLLYVGAAQLLYMDRIPDSAACDETVKAAKELTDIHRAGFVNGVLRSICRERAKVSAIIAAAPENIRFSMHESVCGMIRRQYPGQADEIFETSFSRPGLSLRANTLKNTVPELVSFLSENGVVAEINEETGALTVVSGSDTAVSLTASGRFYIQGANSQYAVKLLDARPGMTVVDVCSCPGGKSIGAAIDMKNSGRVISLDIHSNKFSLIEASAQTLGISIIETHEHDSRNPFGGVLPETADRVICDVPCSSLGVMASKPEIRYKNIDSLSKLYDTQAEILGSSASYLKVGGVMVYSTCTVNKSENEERIAAFLKKHGNFECTEQKTFLISDSRFDGFYAARLVRRA